MADQSQHARRNSNGAASSKPGKGTSKEEAKRPQREENKANPRRRELVVGKPFDANFVVNSEGFARLAILAAVFVVATLFLAGSAIYGMFHWRFAELQGIWAVVGPIYGGIAAFYFGGRHGRNGG